MYIAEFDSYIDDSFVATWKPDACALKPNDLKAELSEGRAKDERRINESLLYT
ncbi:MAG TPA: hypothetical protein PKM91_17290 [Cyclobacteriaceae bacterium]|nr:hypothetical protein [Cyclobacteriaceae bacterium]